MDAADKLEPNDPASVPPLWPVVSDYIEFVHCDAVSFGWDPKGFRIYEPNGAKTKVFARFPLTRQGWFDCWAALERDFVDLAQATSQLVEGLSKSQPEGRSPGYPPGSRLNDDTLMFLSHLEPDESITASTRVIAVPFGTGSIPLAASRGLQVVVVQLCLTETRLLVWELDSFNRLTGEVLHTFRLADLIACEVKVGRGWVFKNCTIVLTDQDGSVHEFRAPKPIKSCLALAETLVRRVQPKGV